MWTHPLRPAKRQGVPGESETLLALPAKVPALRRVFWCPDFRIILQAATFLPEGSGRRAAFVPGHSGGAVLEFHQLPSRR